MTNNNQSVPSEFWKEETHYEDVGHKALVAYLQAVYKEASNRHFHDYKNKKYPLPKVALVSVLETIIARAKKGYYDNKNEI